MAEEKDAPDDRYLYKDGDLKIVSPGEGAPIIVDDEEGAVPELPEKTPGEKPEAAPKRQKAVHVHLHGDGKPRVRR